MRIAIDTHTHSVASSHAYSTLDELAKGARLAWLDGFVLSDHVDWPGLVSSIEATGAERVWVTHGYTAQVVRWLEERGYDALAVETRFTGERADLDAEPAADAGDADDAGAAPDAEAGP